MARRPSRKTQALDLVTPPDVLAGETLLPAPRQERSRRTREALLSAALRLFAKAGYEAASIEEIARAARVAVGAFYLHFRSKRQILLVLFDRFLRDLAAIVPPDPAAFVGPHARDLVDDLVRAGLRVDVAYLGAYRAWREAVPRDRELGKLDASIEAWTTARLVALLTVLATRADVRPGLAPEALATALNALFWRLLETGLGERDDVVEATVALVSRAVFRDDPSTSAKPRRRAT